MNINSTYGLVANVNDLFNELFNDDEVYNWSHKGPLSSKIEVPGYNKENLSMKVESGDLLVVRSNKEDENDKILYRLQLTKDIDRKNIKAKSQDGVLHLTLPAFTKKESKCISIE